MPLYALIHEDGQWSTMVGSLDDAIKEALESYQYTMIFEHVTDIWKIPPMKSSIDQTDQPARISENRKESVDFG